MNWKVNSTEEHTDNKSQGEIYACSLAKEEKNIWIIGILPVNKNRFLIQFSKISSTNWKGKEKAV